MSDLVLLLTERDVAIIRDLIKLRLYYVQDMIHYYQREFESPEDIVRRESRATYKNRIVYEQQYLDMLIDLDKKLVKLKTEKEDDNNKEEEKETGTIASSRQGSDLEIDIGPHQEQITAYKAERIDSSK